jgi:DNA-binding GntR family transcriptional regulator
MSIFSHRAGAPPVSSTGDRIYRAIKDEIVALRIPPGTMLDESRLAEQYGVSRTPVREALRRLEQDGLIVTVPRRGSFVAAPSIEDVIEIDQVRLVLEPLAARQAAGRIDGEALDAIEARLEAIGQTDGAEENRLALLEADSELHDLIMRAAGNRCLREIVVSLHNRISSVRLISTASRFRVAIAEHRELIAALRAGDPEASEEAMRRHLRAARVNRDRLFDLGHAGTPGLPWREQPAGASRAAGGTDGVETELGSGAEKHAPA